MFVLLIDQNGKRNAVSLKKLGSILKLSGKEMYICPVGPGLTRQVQSCQGSKYETGNQYQLFSFSFLERKSTSKMISTKQLLLMIDKIVPARKLVSGQCCCSRYLSGMKNPQYLESCYLCLSKADGRYFVTLRWSRYSS